MRHFPIRTALLLLLSLNIILGSPSALAAEGMVTLKSPHSVADTAIKLERILAEKGMTVFGRIDHAEGAQAAGLELRPTQVVIFGNPKVGTPLMHCAQSVAIDLPQKMLVWQDEDGQVWLGYNDPQYLKERHGIEGDKCDEVLARIEGALGNVARAAAAE